MSRILDFLRLRPRSDERRAPNAKAADPGQPPPEDSGRYLIQPRAGGFLNDLLVSTEGGLPLYHVRAKTISVSGRRYLVSSHGGDTLYTTQQDHTVVFPRHRLLENGYFIGRLGQAGIIPLNYFVELRRNPRMEIHIGGFESVFRLLAGDAVVACAEQHRSTWQVTIHQERDRKLLAIALAILYRESCIGG